MPSHHIERVNTLIQREASKLIQNVLRDPRLSAFISVTEVSVSPDLRYAKIYVSSIDGEEKKTQILAALTSAAGFMRTELAKVVRLRRMPELLFEWDNSIEKGDRVLRLIDEVSKEEK
ncbi:MAG TPA: 30S ribosome-binding factor RbfA [Dehalococcoidales bacterium]|nr:30S ribosome-binding factor RbfA [Dehalococcoidales bacterium]